MNLMCLNEKLESFQKMLFQDNLDFEELEKLISNMNISVDSAYNLKYGVAEAIAFLFAFIYDN